MVYVLLSQAVSRFCTFELLPKWLSLPANESKERMEKNLLREKRFNFFLRRDMIHLGIWIWNPEKSGQNSEK